MGEQAVAGAIERFMEQARRSIARGHGPAEREEIGRRLGELAGSDAISTSAIHARLHGMSAEFTILAKDPEGPTLMLARFPETEPTPVHDHKSWGVAYVLSGRDRHLHWRRLDDGSEPGRARLAIDDDRAIPQGGVVHWSDPPDDIHSQQGIGGPAFELVFFGQDPTVRPRNYFDPERQTVRAVRPA